MQIQRAEEIRHVDSQNVVICLRLGVFRECLLQPAPASARGQEHAYAVRLAKLVAEGAGWVSFGRHYRRSLIGESLVEQAVMRHKNTAWPGKAWPQPLRGNGDPNAER